MFTRVVAEYIGGGILFFIGFLVGVKWDGYMKRMDERKPRQDGTAEDLNTEPYPGEIRPVSRDYQPGTGYLLHDSDLKVAQRVRPWFSYFLHCSNCGYHWSSRRAGMEICPFCAAHGAVSRADLAEGRSIVSVVEHVQGSPSPVGLRLVVIAKNGDKRGWAK